MTVTTIESLERDFQTATASRNYAVYVWPQGAVEWATSSLELHHAKDATIMALQDRNEALRVAAVSLTNQLAALRARIAALEDEIVARQAQDNEPTRAQAAGYPGVIEEE